jgi:hypothetical protein
MDTGAGSRLDTTIYISGDRGAADGTGHDAGPTLVGARPIDAEALAPNPTLPSGALHDDPAQRTVVVLTPRAPELRLLTRNLSP